jgi:regulator of sigma E protease
VQPVDYLWAIPVFGLLIFIHELGHFGAAKLFGIRVREFALGFGPTIGGFDWGETRYNLRLVPLGGFVLMAGMEEADADDPRGFVKKPLWQRALVIAAGPLMNFVLAALLFAAFLFFIGMPSTETTVIGEVPERCAEAVVDGMSTQLPCPAYAAGIRSGDRVVAINGKKVAAWQDVLQQIAQSGGAPLTFAVDRQGETREFKVTPLHADGRWKVGIAPANRPVPLGRALVEGSLWTADFAVTWVYGLTMMVTGQVKPELSGPVGITMLIAETASQGLDTLLRFTAVLSINLGMFNLLPIPALDGSRLVFLGVELVRGRRLDPRRESMVHLVGFLILIGLMVVITYGEVFRR